MYFYLWCIFILFVKSPMFITENLSLEVIDEQLTGNESENKMCMSINKVFKSERK